MFFRIAETVALRGTCPRAQVGAVLTKEGRVVSIGYNGAPPGMPECHEVECELGPDGGCERTTHAEANTIVFAARSGIDTDHTIMYSTHAPCYTCAKLLIGAGVRVVFFDKPYRDTRGVELLDKALVVVQQRNEFDYLSR